LRTRSPRSRLRPSKLLGRIDRFDLEQLIGNLCYSINHMKLGRPFYQLFDLYDRLKAAERYADGDCDVP
jgi:hypothetical protein